MKSRLVLVREIGLKTAVGCRQLWVGCIIPRAKKYTEQGMVLCKQKLVPTIQKGSSRVGEELIKIHKKQNWMKRFAVTMFDNSAGLGMALISAKIVENSVEVSEFANLWGLLATRPVVSEATYEMLGFVVEFFVALVAFTLTEHFRDEYRQSKQVAAE